MLGLLIPVGGGDPIPLLKPNLIVGRRRTCDIRLEYADVELRHCRLEFFEDQWRAVDTSRNGTKVNGDRIEEQVLESGDTIAFARHAHQIQYPVPPGFVCLKPATIISDPEGWTDRTRKVLNVATACAVRQGVVISPEHMLLALARVEEGVGRFALREMGLNIGKRAPEIERLTKVHQETCETSVPGALTNRLIDEAKNAARQMQHNYIGTEHLMMGLLSCGDTPATRYLQHYNIELDAYQSMVRRILAPE